MIGQLCRLPTEVA